jgi:hypothetical protein
VRACRCVFHDPVAVVAVGAHHLGLDPNDLHRSRDNSDIYVLTATLQQAPIPCPWRLSERGGDCERSENKSAGQRASGEQRDDDNDDDDDDAFLSSGGGRQTCVLVTRLSFTWLLLF